MVFLFLLISANLFAETIVYPDLDWSFSSPYGIAVSEGEVYVADSGNHRIRKFDKGGKLILEFGRFGEECGEFNFPYDVAVDKDGDIYVADTWNNRIQRFSRNGSFILSWGRLGDSAGNFKFPHSLAVDADSVYVADTGNRRVQKFSKDGGFILEFGGLKWPTGIDIEGEALWVSDAEKNMVMKFSKCGELLDQIGGFDNPHGLVAGEDVYVADTGGNSILRIKDGKVSAFLSEIKSPYDVAVGDSIYVAETGANRVLLFDRDGKMDECWQTQGAGFGRFSAPCGIVCGKGGDVYVADTGNNRVYRLDSSLVPKDTWNISTPVGMTMDDEANLYVVSNSLHKVVKFDRFGNCIIDWEDEMISPKGIAYSTFSKNLYVSDTERDCLLTFTNDGRFLGTLAGGLSDPAGVVCDRQGNLYVADTGAKAIKVFSLSGALKREIKEGISYPLGLTIDQEGNLYVSQENGDICKMNQFGTILQRFSGMKYPQGVYINEGYLYVTDTGNNRLKKISLEERVDTEKRGIFEKLAYKEVEGLQSEPPKKEGHASCLIELKDVIKVTEKPTKKEEQETPYVVKIEEEPVVKIEEELAVKTEKEPVVKMEEELVVEIEEGLEEELAVKMEEEPKEEKRSALPDLVIEDLSLSGSEVNKWARVSAKIKNAGETSAESIPLEFFANKELIWFDRTIPYLGCNEDKTKSIIWKPLASGSYTLNVIVDPSNAIAESNEENNRRDIEVFVK
ncbi:MAG: CARDB domain-containing protein [Candidatus Desantisbacteria bacterium]|mgnify:CR=1 FL=1